MVSSTHEYYQAQLLQNVCYLYNIARPRDSLDDMKAAVRSVILDPGFQVSTAGKEAQAVTSQVFELLENCSDTARATVIDIIGAVESCVARGVASHR